MAGDWIKMRTNLDTDPRVIEMAATLDVSEMEVIGCLWKVWSWADSHSLDGNAIRVTGVTLDRFTGLSGFADALRNVGWLEGRDNALTFPRFAEHNGQTAKKRAETNQRVKKHRNTKCVTDVTHNALPEKRREEKRIKEKDNKKKSLLDDLEFPDSLDNPECRTALETWVKYKAERKQAYKSKVALTAILNKFAPRGPTAFCNAILHSMACNYQGIYEENGTDGRTKKQNSRTNPAMF